MNTPSAGRPGGPGRLPRNSLFLLLGLLTAAGCAGRSAKLPDSAAGPHPAWSYPAMPDPAPSTKPLYRLAQMDFALNATDLTHEDMGTLGLIVGRMVAEPRMRLLIVGFADKVGEADKAPRLSEARIRSTRMYLVQHSIAESRLETGSFGSSLAQAGADQPELQSRDRKVELWVLQE